MKILQINIDRGGGALDLMLKMANDGGYDICLVGEPHKRRTKDWFGHLDAKFFVVNENLPISNKGMGSGHSWVDINNIRIVSCYISPNSGLDDLSNILEEISVTIRNRGRNEVIIAGDVNAKSWGWGCPIQNRRGRIVAEWIEAENLVIHNVGNTPTFKRRAQESIIDITLSSEGIAANIYNWQVLDDFETLSLHQYISFEVNNNNTRSTDPQVTNTFKGWNLKSLNKDALRNHVSGCTATDEKELSLLITSACNKSMKKRSTQKIRESYWWNEDIDNKRKECIKKRRTYTRTRRLFANTDMCDRLYDEYKTAKNDLKTEIHKSKSNSWKNICSELEKDIWGQAYKIVTKKIKHKLPAIPSDVRRSQLDKLFPNNPLIVWRHRQISENEIEPVNNEELLEASLKLAPNKAPGPDCISPNIVREVVLEIPDVICGIFNKLLHSGTFPKIWKEARVTLIEKPTKTRGDPPAYRPICLINTLGKLFEGILNERLKKEIVEKHLLSDFQFGFREGRSTVHAIRKIKDIAGGELRKRGNCSSRCFCLLITLDIQNAFNSANWGTVITALAKKGVSKYLIRMMESYLSEREIVGEEFPKNMSAGVPQGSILGPTLWNLLYDGVLQLKIPHDVTLVAYADDLAIIALGRTEEELEMKANTTLEIVGGWMRDNKLAVAPAKSEAMVISGRKVCRPIKIKFGNQEITQKNIIKYLGVVLDRKLNFHSHIDYVTAKAEKTVAALSRIVPNLGGPGENKRRLLQYAADSIILYAAPIWVESLKIKKNKAKILSIQRKFALRVGSLYRTVSAEAAAVVARVIPIDLLLIERDRTFDKNKEEKIRERENTIYSWQQRWDLSTKGIWTKTLIPEITPWLKREHGEIDYFLSQALTGHGCFQEFVHKIGKAATPICLFCEENDGPEHTLFKCGRWDSDRYTAKAILGQDINKHNIIKLMLESPYKWEAIKTMTKNILKNKSEHEMRLRAEQASLTAAVQTT